MSATLGATNSARGALPAAQDPAAGLRTASAQAASGAPTAWPEYERVVGHDPLVVYKRVRWADCDPAGVVFTGKFSEYLLLAAGYMFSALAQGDYMRWTASLGVDTPCKGMELEFHRALWPEDEFWMTCRIGAIRAHSYDIVVEAHATDGTPIFSGRFSPICIRRDARQRTDIPQALRDALQQRLAKTGETA